MKLNKKLGVALLVGALVTLQPAQAAVEASFWSSMDTHMVSAVAALNLAAAAALAIFGTFIAFKVGKKIVSLWSN